MADLCDAALGWMTIGGVVVSELLYIKDSKVKKLKFLW
jgi:hypothetical protein